MFGAGEKPFGLGAVSAPFSLQVVLFPGVHYGVGGFYRRVDPVGGKLPCGEVVGSEFVSGLCVLSVCWEEALLFFSFDGLCCPADGVVDVVEELV